MAKMRINIVNPVVSLITNVRHLSNDYKSVFLFDIETTIGATIDITLQRMNLLVEDYDTAEIKPEGGAWQPAGGQIVLPLGKAEFKLSIGNVQLVAIKNGPGYCNKTTVTIEDITNSVTDSMLFQRCDTGIRL